ncbi:hypothetical protein KKH27_08985 [bacterium]|nr:hypothetical protein [bacterium]MBU1983110.1 hypothetical protein [bacterium]
MTNSPLQLAERIRDRLCERALAGSPQWLAPVLPAARHTAGSLLVGNLTGKLPVEDASAMVTGILAEQNGDGSWSRYPDDPGDLSVTLEIVQALSTLGDGSARTALGRAIHWLEQNRRRELDPETLLFIGALSDIPPGRIRRWQMSAARWLTPRFRVARPRNHAGNGLRLALKIMGLEQAHARAHLPALLESQRADGSWDGSARATAFALVALRHALLPVSDTAFERGWRFLRALQLWDHGGLIQNPCDLSVLFHATAVRSVLTADAEPEAVMGSTLTLLHHCDDHGRWAAGSSLPADHLTTALALDALSFAGDTPVDTAWARRRVVLQLLRSQREDGGWPLFADPPRSVFGRLAGRGFFFGQGGCVEATAAVVQALAYSGVAEMGQRASIEAGVRFLLRRQGRGGFWRNRFVGSDLLATAMALEALAAAGSANCAAAVIRTVATLVLRQLPDGGWNDPPEWNSSVHHTAWVLRGLSGARGVPEEVLQRAREFLRRRVDPSELLWSHAAGRIAIPAVSEEVVVPELTSLWALEALVPLGIPGRARMRERRHARSLFERNK